MHELSVAQSIAQALDTRAAEQNATRVKAVRLRIGDAAGIATESLTFCFEMLASADPVLAGARLVIDAVPHRARCSLCDTEFAVVNFVARCPHCGEWSDEVVSGTELQILEMEIET